MGGFVQGLHIIYTICSFKRKYIYIHKSLKDQRCREPSYFSKYKHGQIHFCITCNVSRKKKKKKMRLKVFVKYRVCSMYFIFRDGSCYVCTISKHHMGEWVEMNAKKNGAQGYSYNFWLLLFFLSLYLGIKPFKFRHLSKETTWRNCTLTL